MLLSYLNHLTKNKKNTRQVGIAANETIGGAVGCGANGGDETRAASAGSSGGGGGFYVIEQGQGDFVHCAGETITADMKVSACRIAPNLCANVL